jgi:hypothetical protein
MSEVWEATFLFTLNAINSSFMVLNTTGLCFLLHKETMENSKEKQKPDVLF